MTEMGPKPGGAGGEKIRKDSAKRNSSKIKMLGCDMKEEKKRA